MRARLIGLATTPAPHRADQRTIAHFLGRVAAEQADPQDRDRLIRKIDLLSERSAIDARYTVLSDYLATDPADFTFYPKTWKLDPFPTTRARMALYETKSVDLAARAARKAIAAAAIDPKQITHLVLTTCTGFFAPGPDVLLIDRLGLDPNVERTQLGFMGCYAGFAAIRNAAQIARGDPEAVVLTASVELCSLHFQRELDVETLVANTLFSDGAAAALWSQTKGEALAEVRAVRSRVAPNTLDRMGWRIGDHGFRMTLDAEVPRALEDEAPPFFRELLARAGLDRDRLGELAIHPGGKKILDAIARALGGADLSISRSVLRDYGNMSSAAIFFVLERALSTSTGPLAALGFGPGLTMEGVVLAR